LGLRGEQKAELISRSKASYYGFESEADLAIYTITAYLLGVNFDKEYPAANQILTDPAFTATEKATQLQEWTQLLLKTLEEGKTDDSVTSDVPPQEAAMPDYLYMQEDSGPYREKGEWVVQQLITGNISGFKDNFSPSFLRQLGLEEVENICNQYLIPFFAGSERISNAATVTLTTDAFGNTGYAFYLSALQNNTEKPFVIYMVNENNRIVIANLLPNKSYQDMH
jgi:hypothetical protein